MAECTEDQADARTGNAVGTTVVPFISERHGSLLHE